MTISTSAVERRAHAVSEARARLADAARDNNNWEGPATPDEAVTVLLAQADRIESYLNTGKIDAADGSSGDSPRT
jgi:soluble cytochrome b562